MGELCPNEPNDAYRVVLVKNDDAEAPQCITINGAAVVQNDFCRDAVPMGRALM